jgi:NAD-dependent SIR2 family protein deacetylase
MPSWMVRCPSCHGSFEHSRIGECLEDLLFPARPKLPPDGSLLKCPSCGHEALYHGEHLFYQP